MNTIMLLTAALTMQSAELPDTAAFSQELEELVITAKKEVIKSDGASLIYDLSEDDSTKGLTLLEALRKVPLVTVDGEDKVRINGDSNFKIYVNGKEDPMLEANYDKIFKSMPAEGVRKIEVITEPGAKYDAEGTGGILNIITQTNQKKDGYSGTLNASLSNRDYFLSLSGRMKYKNFSADAQVTYGGSAFCDQTNDQVYTTVDDDSNLLHRQVANSRQRFGFSYTDASLNASWEPNESNLFTFGGSYMGFDAKVKGVDSTTKMFNREGQSVWEYTRHVTGKIRNLSSTANASYQHNFGDRSHYVVAAWMFAFGRNPVEFLSGISDTENFPVEYTITSNHNTNYTRENTLQIDYANPFGGEIHKLETGAKAILRHNTGIGGNAMGKDDSPMNIDPESDVNLTQKQDVYALYASYSGTFDKCALKAGIRYEHTSMGVRDNLDRSKDFTRSLNDVVPNMALTYLFSPSSNLRLAYQMRITRPSLDRMNPYAMNILGSYVQEGNPDLKSEKSNNITLTYTGFGRIMGGNIYLGYKNVDNAIVNYTYFTKGTDGTLVNHQTSANIGKRHEISLGGFLNIYITRNMNLSVNGRVEYLKLFSPSPLLKTCGWTGNYGANWSWTGPADIHFSAYGGQSFRNILIQGYYSGWYYYGIGIARNFLKDLLSVSVTATNFLQGSMHFRNLTTSEKMTTTIDLTQYQWKVGVGITWNFGNLNSQTKKTDTQIENNDISTSGSKGGIGI